MSIQSLTNSAKTRIVKATTVTIRGVNFDITLQVVVTPASPRGYTRKRPKKTSLPIRTNYLTIVFPDGDAEELQIVFGEIFPEKGIKLWLRNLGSENLLEELVETAKKLHKSVDSAEGVEDGSLN